MPSSLFLYEVLLLKIDHLCFDSRSSTSGCFSCLFSFGLRGWCLTRRLDGWLAIGYLSDGDGSCLRYHYYHLIGGGVPEIPLLFAYYFAFITYFGS